MAIKYGKVIGRFLGAVEDGIDSDDEPDLVPLQGTVTFTPAASKVLVLGDTPYSLFPQTIKATLDGQGYLSHNLKRGVKLIAPTEDINPHSWTWRVSFDLRRGTNKVAADPFDIELSAYVPGPNPNNPDQESTAVDLARVSPVPSSPGNAIVRGDKGDSVKAISFDQSTSSLLFTIGDEDAEAVHSVEVVLPASGGNIFIDTDGVPYFDESRSDGLSLALDTDGVPYIND